MNLKLFPRDSETLRQRKPIPGNFPWLFMGLFGWNWNLILYLINYQESNRFSKGIKLAITPRTIITAMKSLYLDPYELSRLAS